MRSGLQTSCKLTSSSTLALKPKICGNQPLGWVYLIQKPVRPTAGAINTKPHFPQRSDVINFHVESVLLTALKPVIQQAKRHRFYNLQHILKPRYISYCFWCLHLATCPHSSAAASPLCCHWLQTQTCRSGCLYLRSARLLLLQSPHK